MREYVKSVKDIFNYKGRTRRREYWVASLMHGAIAMFVISLFNSKEDNQWGPNPKLANEYTSATSIVVSIVLYIIMTIVYFVGAVANMMLDPSLFVGMM